MIYRPSNFKKSSRAVTAVAAAGLFVTASLMATGPVSAETGKDFVSACASIKDGAQRAACTIEAVKKDTAAREQNIVRLKKEQQEAKAIGVCYDFLIGKVNAGVTTKDEVVKKAGGDLNDTNVCKVAESYGRKAELRPAGAPVSIRAMPVSLPQ